MSDFLFFGGGLIAGGGIFAKLCGRNEKVASGIGAISCIAGLLLVLCGFFLQTFLGEAAMGLPCLHTPFAGSNSVFLLILCLVGIASAYHAPGYLDGHADGRTGFFWLYFNLTVTAMLAVISFHSFLPFLIAWELMGLFSFLLVAFDMKSQETMKAAWIYLLACEAGGMLLMFFSRYVGLEATVSSRIAFILLAIAFGLKCGFPLLHVWLPVAHPAAPAPVSALMSGAMIPLGFCGLFRFLPFCGCPDAQLTLFYGWFLLLLGMAGAFSGILTGLAQKDLKRLLACSSIENIGIMAMGFGFGFLGAGYQEPFMCVFGFAGAFLHILNHALLKGALFLSAGAVLKSVHTLNMEEMGGLMKKMPVTGTSFCLSALGISGLPPFCGFSGELLIYAAGFCGIAGASGCRLAGCYAAVIVLALTGAVACAALVKSFFAVFQGEPRTEHARDAHREDSRMNVGLLLLVIPALLMPFLAEFLPMAGGLHPVAAAILRKNAIISLIFTGITEGLWFLRSRLAVSERKTGTWDCGYARPSARMEYTGTAFVQPLLDLFNGFFRQKKKIRKPDGPFPEDASYVLETEDCGVRYFWKPIFRFIAGLSDRVHRFQSGYLHLYILILTAALALMLVWALGFSGGAE